MTARKQDRPLSARLAVLSEAVPAAQRRARECEMTHRRVVAEIAQLTDAVAEAYADDDEARAAKASKQRATLELGSLRDAEERLEGARRAQQRADVERATFAAENLPGLLHERADEAQAVARQVEQALARLMQAHVAWTATEQDVAALFRLAGRETRDVARFPAELAELVRHARRVGAIEVPAPLPVAIAGAPARAPRAKREIADAQAEAT
jgi:hypothetical protein